ncbi:MAG TPA: carboxypeptidase regulatory-like domain-containing protein [Verrucomicrobiae bacterium]|nr:carboxypeptidase regulatory-like domain-containing protein [Verrucomicrobiae bacterium]
MKRLLYGCSALVLALLLAGAALAQTEQLNGQVLDKDGKPYPGVTVQIKNTATGQTFTTKTDKNGNYVQLGVTSGVYDVTFSNAQDNFTYTQRVQVMPDQSTPLNISVKDLMAKAAIENPDAEKKKAEEENSFKAMKEHFQNGLNAMDAATPLRAQVKTLPADQRGDVQTKLEADYTTAINEFQQAEKDAGPKEAKNHALVLAHLGEAYEYAGRYADAADAFQKAITLEPQAAFYTHASTDLANAAVGQADPKVQTQDLAEANSSCEKAIALDPTVTSMCWKNIGIVLSNKGLLAQAVEPLQKATQADPKDSQAWYLLGGALAATIQTKEEGGKLIYEIPPGTLEAYQHCVDGGPNTPIGQQCKAALDGLQQLSGGEDITMKNRKKK